MTQSVLGGSRHCGGPTHEILSQTLQDFDLKSLVLSLSQNGYVIQGKPTLLDLSLIWKWRWISEPMVSKTLPAQKLDDCRNLQALP